LKTFVQRWKGGKTVKPKLAVNTSWPLRANYRNGKRWGRWTVELSLLSELRLLVTRGKGVEKAGGNSITCAKTFFAKTQAAEKRERRVKHRSNVDHSSYRF